jgi:hypothetical protein
MIKEKVKKSTEILNNTNMNNRVSHQHVSRKLKYFQHYPNNGWKNENKNPDYHHATSSGFRHHLWDTIISIRQQNRDRRVTRREKRERATQEMVERKVMRW